MASSSSNPNVPDEMDQLVSLQRSGLLSMSDFLRMSREFNKTDADRLEEAPSKSHDGVQIDKASTKSSPGIEILVDESGDLFDATEHWRGIPYRRASRMLYTFPRVRPACPGLSAT